MKDLEKSKNRKLEHIKYAMEAYSKEDYFKDIKIFNNSVPEINYSEIDLGCNFFNKKIDMPIMINAMTGGTDLSFEINRDLSIIAKEFNIPMAVGSQAIMFKDKELERTFKVARENNKNGIILSNLSALSPLENVKKAIDLIEADGIQLHLNPSQELVMTEGDRNFKGMLKNIENIIKNIEVPVIVKEVGSGISFDACKELINAGVEYVDVGGKGGTSFIKIETLRKTSEIFEEIEEIEIPTPQSILFCKLAKSDLNIISSGGISKGSHIIKSIMLGANISGISGPILYKYFNGGMDEVIEYINSLRENTKILMGCLGCETIEDIKKVKYYYKEEDIIKNFVKSKINI